MKLNDNILKKIERFAFDKVKNNDILHRTSHIERVVKNCSILARKEKADFKICKAAALLHDIGRSKGSKNHAETGEKMTKKFLKKLKLDENIIEQICYAVLKHNKNLPNKTIESKVVHDADNLDALGSFGFIRLIMDGSCIKEMNFNESIEYTLIEQKKFARWLQTKSARKIAKEKMREVEKFIKHLK